MPNPRTLSEYAIVLNADDVASILRISRTKAYDLMHRKDFPTIMVGKRMIVSTDRFFEWLANADKFNTTA